MSEEYCSLLAAHPEAAAASDDVMRLVLYSIHKNDFKIVSALNETVKPTPIPGISHKP